MRILCFSAVCCCGCLAVESPPIELPLVRVSCQQWGLDNATLALMNFEFAVENGQDFAESCSAARRYCEERTEPGCLECRLAVVAQVFGRDCDSGVLHDDPNTIALACEGWNRGEVGFLFFQFFAGTGSGQTLEGACAASVEFCESSTEPNCVSCTRAMAAHVYGEECTP